MGINKSIMQYKWKVPHYPTLVQQSTTLHPTYHRYHCLQGHCQNRSNL